MTISSLDLSRVEQGIGSGKIVLIAGDPTKTAPLRVSGFTTTAKILPAPDRLFDISSANSIRSRRISMS